MGRFANEMTKAVAERGVTLYRVAKRTDLSEPFIRRLAAGVGLPSDEAVQRIAEALDWPAWRLHGAAVVDRVGPDHLRDASRYLDSEAV